MAKEKKKKKVKKTIEVSAEFTKLALDVIKKFPTQFGHIASTDITVLKYTGYGSAKWLGKCFPVRQPYAAILGDLCYIIGVNIDGLTDAGVMSDPHQKALKILIYHEI